MRYCLIACSLMIVNEEGKCPIIQPRPLWPCPDCRYWSGQQNGGEGRTVGKIFIRRARVGRVC